MHEMTHIRERVAQFCTESGVPGYVAGVYRGGETEIAAHGTADITTGAPMTAGTGLLFGSITKVMTTMLVLQQVEQGRLDLDRPVVDYLPEFRLAEPGAAEKILVRHLVTHTSGIDADLYFPREHYLEGLAEQCGTLFEPGQYVSYSNGGMNVAGRLLEAVTGVAYLELLRRDVYEPLGLRGAGDTTAIGHFPGADGAARPTTMFKLPDTWAAAGASAIGTVGDLLTLGRAHLRADNPMAVKTHDMGVANVPAIGMGWLLEDFGSVTVLCMSGASPGGVAVLAVVPALDLVFAAYGNDPRAFALHNELLPWLVGQHTPVTFRPLPAAPAEDLERYAGTYRSQQLRVDVRVVDGQLEETVTYEPADADQEAIFTAFAGGTVAAPPHRYAPVAKDLFAPAGLPLESLTGYSRVYLVSYLGDEHGHPTHRCAGGRMTKRTPC
ncbi:beta-lactamase family protein [Dactylosporangium vinaceum]|uniref:Serine hydrolase domain-containing protein n=1 Tax=Dactylosporangium vinaceum TaxID=53362 RepID=A0ABV5M1F1_9ACTN|nr:serine hydrolase domain-containing protein [Dactylosporangium vinaceum]UAB99185.1 beta-lactamase family protein [Dactylosporangium vinaceum]